MTKFPFYDFASSRTSRIPGHRDDGFSTIEAIVSVAILAVCLLPILDFQMNVSDGAVRLQKKQEELSATARAESYLRGVPGSLSEQGEILLGDLHVTWHQSGREPARKVISEQGAPGRFDVSLVRYEVAIHRGGEQIGKVQIDRVEWVAVSPFLDF